MKPTEKTSIAIAILLLALLTGCGGERMRARLQFVTACNEADTVFTKAWLPTVDSLVDFFSSFGTPNERMTACYLQGRVHHDLGEAPQSLDCYQQAAEQADTTQNDCNLRTLYAVYGQMADVFEAQYLPDDEMKALKTAERIAWKNKDTLDALVAFDLRSRPYYLKNEKDSVMTIEKQARERYLKYGYQEKAAQAILYTIDNLLDSQQYAEVKQYMEIFEQESGWIDSYGNIKEGKELYYYDKGRYLIATGQVDSALLYFYRTLEGHKEAAYEGLLSVYETKNIPDSIAKYARLFASANDSSFLHVNQEKVHQITAMYDYSHHQQMAKQKEQEARFWKYTIIGLLFTGFLIAAFGYAKHKRDKKDKVEAINRLTADYQSAKTNSQRLSEDLAVFKGMKEANEKMVEERERQIKELNEKVAKYEVRLQSLRTEEKLMALKQCDIVEFFIQKKQHTPNYSAPSNQDWKKLKKAFLQFVPSIASAIDSESRLSEQEQRICLLETLGFFPSEMALILGTTPQVVTNAKASANQKLFSQKKASTLGQNLKNQYLV